MFTIFCNESKTTGNHETVLRHMLYRSPSLTEANEVSGVLSKYDELVRKSASLSELQAKLAIQFPKPTRVQAHVLAIKAQDMTEGEFASLNRILNKPDYERWTSVSSYKADESVPVFFEG